MSAQTPAIAGRRVLLVEDDYFIATHMQGHFEESGAQVLGPVPSVEAALTLIAETSDIDAAVLDINLREELVFPVADALQARGIPFLFATGYGRTVLPPRFMEIGHCEKPVEPVQLARTLQR